MDLKNHPAASVGIPYNGPLTRRGSAVRGGRSVVAAGASIADIGIGATETLDFEFSEPCALGKLVVSATTEAARAALAVTSIKIGGDELLGATEEIHVDMFAKDCVSSPGFLHSVSESTKVTVTIKNYSAAVSGPVFAGFTAA